MGSFFGWFGSIFTMVFWILILVGLLRLIQWLGNQGKMSGRQTLASASETPIDILKKRYARGDLAKEQYEAMKRDLE
ncbi:SHOCT domain-containing protein [Desulfoferrobacter suflitae]|uniref:SHOCT domain-containing protein n=1 Tax=Desulfoferrobacter suflitae TaxID=2865782 RepID=UPI0021647980|nr:SHOCT domain-containing protein [Desulfoferrobacter suflitae]MCK8603677.1 SHOCT domain-containing protein [Desulfoferrobacter suflitae]